MSCFCKGGKEGNMQVNWERGKHAALDITVTSPLIPSILTAACLSEGAEAEKAEARKHRANDPKCSELCWVCIPLVVETYGNWGREAQSTFSHLASHLAIIHKCRVLTELYSRLKFTLVRVSYWQDVLPPLASRISFEFFLCNMLHCVCCTHLYLYMISR